MYADDTSISHSSRSVTDLTNAINSDLQVNKDLSISLQGNKLAPNVVKTQSMTFGTEPNLKMIYRDASTSFHLFQINDGKLESTDNIKYLGLKLILHYNRKSKLPRLPVRSHEE